MSLSLRFVPSSPSFYSGDVGAIDLLETPCIQEGSLLV